MTEHVTYPIKEPIKITHGFRSPAQDMDAMNHNIYDRKYEDNYREATQIIVAVTGFSAIQPGHLGEFESRRVTECHHCHNLLGRPYFRNA